MLLQKLDNIYLCESAVASVSNGIMDTTHYSSAYCLECRIKPSYMTFANLKYLGIEQW